MEIITGSISMIAENGNISISLVNLDFVIPMEREPLIYEGIILQNDYLDNDNIINSTMI